MNKQHHQTIPLSPQNANKLTFPVLQAFVRVISVLMPWAYFLPIIGCFALYWIISTLRLAYRTDLSPLPGPGWARFTGLYRVYRLWSGKAPSVYLELHQKYSPIVRTRPKTVSIADPTTIPTIYGIGSNFLKVAFILVELFSTNSEFFSRNFTQQWLPSTRMKS